MYLNGGAVGQGAKDVLRAKVEYQLGSSPVQTMGRCSGQKPGKSEHRWLRHSTAVAGEVKTTSLRRVGRRVNVPSASREEGQESGGSRFHVGPAVGDDFRGCQWS